jgi:hypothetical protein
MATFKYFWTNSYDSFTASSLDLLSSFITLYAKFAGIQGYNPFYFTKIMLLIDIKFFGSIGNHLKLFFIFIPGDLFNFLTTFFVPFNDLSELFVVQLLSL